MCIFRMGDGDRRRSPPRDVGDECAERDDEDEDVDEDLDLEESDEEEGDDDDVELDELE